MFINIILLFKISTILFLHKITISYILGFINIDFNKVNLILHLKKVEY